MDWGRSAVAGLSAILTQRENEEEVEYQAMMNCPEELFVSNEWKECGDKLR
jgi:hypothetical protein